MERRHLEIFASNTTDTETHTNENDASPRIDRRSAMSALVAGAALVQTACGTTSPTFGNDDAGTTNTTDDSGTSTSSCDNTPAGVDAGDVSGFPAGTWKMAGSNRDPFIVAQDANGLFAYSAICTHEGCKIGTPSSTGATTCPCHGAKFDGNGAVTKGPARTNLSHYAVALCGGHVYVDTATTVDASTRTPAS